MRAFWAGVTWRRRVIRSTSSSSSSSTGASSYGQSTISSISRPTSPHTLRADESLSPVRTLTRDAVLVQSAAMAGAARLLGRVEKGEEPGEDHLLIVHDRVCASRLGSSLASDGDHPQARRLIPRAERRPDRRTVDVQSARSRGHLDARTDGRRPPPRHPCRSESAGRPRPSTTTDIRRRAKSKGISSTFEIPVELHSARQFHVLEDRDCPAGSSDPSGRGC